MAETPNVMPQLHMPLQSGSDTVLKAMRRSYRQAKYLGIIDRVRAAMPDAAITTDIIVGFPGETEEDFQATLDVVARGAVRGRVHVPVLQAPRHPRRRRWTTRSRREVVQDRYERLVALVNDIAWEENKKLVGRRVELMVAEGEGRKDAATHRLSGRGPDNRLVHFTPPEPASSVRPGDMVTVEITYAAPHHLVADGPVLACGVPARATPGRRATAAPAPGRRRRSACRRSACPPRSRTPPPAAEAQAQQPRAARVRGRYRTFVPVATCTNVQDARSAGDRDRPSVGARVHGGVARLGREPVGVLLRLAWPLLGQHVLVRISLGSGPSRRCRRWPAGRARWVRRARC